MKKYFSTVPHHFLTLGLVHTGNGTSVDEKAAGAIYSSQLHMFMGEKPTQNHETQGNESAEFMALFPRGVTYLVSTHLFTSKHLFIRCV